jgi:uncharacterized membrane protein
MAILFALIYPDQPTAEQAALTARGLEEAGFVKILDSSLITKDSDGKIEHQGERHPVRSGATTGAVVGGVTGLLFLAPMAGIAAGAAIGGVIGRWAKSGAGGDFEHFRDRVMSDLQPGGAALVVLGEADNRERLVHDLGRHGGTLVSTDVSSEQIAEIQHEIDKVAAASKQSS